MSGDTCDEDRSHRTGQTSKKKSLIDLHVLDDAGCGVTPRLCGQECLVIPRASHGWRGTAPRGNLVAMGQASRVAHHGVQHVESDTQTVGTGDPRAWWVFTCGHCGSQGSGAVLAYTFDGNYQPRERWVRCPGCGRGSVVDVSGRQVPGVSAVRDVEGLPEDVALAYSEARACASVSAHTACEMVCRKILMHVAVDKGAERGGNFTSYVTSLEEAGYVTPPMKPWVDLIRKRGNIAVHELPHTDPHEALGTLTFTEQLLRNTYEMQALADRFAGPPPS